MPIDTYLDLNLTFSYGAISATTTCPNQYVINYDILLADDSPIASSPIWS